MKIGVIGTGTVGQAHASRLAELGHDVLLGTHDVAKTMAKTKPDQMGRPPVSVWLKSNPKVKLANFQDTAKHGEIIVEALNGQGAVEILKSIEPELNGKTLIDISNPLDFSSGELQLFVVNDDSLAEQIQKALASVKVVKAFNTTNASVQVKPKSLAGGDHHLFIAGNDQKAKDEVTNLAKGYGWKNILDLGNLKSARGMEMFLPIWLKTMKAVGTPNFNYKIVLDKPKL